MTKRTKEKLTKLKHLYNQGLRDAELASKLCISPATAGRWRRRLQLPRHPATPTNLIYEINEDYFQTIDTEDKAYWLGFIYADGNIHDNNEHKKLAASWKFSLAVQWTDMEHINKFLNAIKSTHPLCKRQYGNQNRQPVAVVSIYRQRFAKHLISHGVVPRKTKKLQLPSLPIELIRHFIRGYLDGDGCIYKGIYKTNDGLTRKDYKVTFNSSAKPFLSSISRFIHATYYVPLKSILDGTRCYHLDYHGRQQVLTVLHALYDDAHIFLTRKYKIAQEILATEKAQQLPLFPPSLLQFLSLPEPRADTLIV